MHCSFVDMPATCQLNSLVELGLGMVVATSMQTFRHDPARYNSPTYFALGNTGEALQVA